MKAIELRDGFGLEYLELAERPEPSPGPGQVLVRLRAASLNFRDLMTARGHYNPKQPLPLIPCSDGAGEVVAVGEGACLWKRGDRVCTTFAQRWPSGEMTPQARASTLGGPLDGTLAEWGVFEEGGLVAAPEHLSFEEAATLPCAAVTAWNALVAKGGLKPGQTVLVEGTGGVSLFALQFAVLCGASVIATSSSDDKLERAIALGASGGVNYRTSPDWSKAVRKMAGGQGADHVVEVGGAGTLAGALGAAAFGGTISVIGVLSGTAAPLDVRQVLMKGLKLQGIFVGSRQIFEEMNRAISIHRLKPVVDRVFPLEEARQALKHLETGRHFGKVVIAM